MKWYIQQLKNSLKIKKITCFWKNMILKIITEFDLNLGSNILRKSLRNRTP